MLFFPRNSEAGEVCRSVLGLLLDELYSFDLSGFAYLTTDPEVSWGFNLYDSLDMNLLITWNFLLG